MDNFSGHLRGLDVSFKESTDGHFGDSLDAGFLIAVDFINADVILSITGFSDTSHLDISAFIR